MSYGPNWGGQNEQSAMLQGGITWQIDYHLAALQEATIRDDAYLYANLVAQMAAILAPKLTPEEYEKLSVPDVPEPTVGNRRALRREYERELFAVSRDNLAAMLRIASEKGLYARKDESAPQVVDATGLAIKE